MSSHRSLFPKPFVFVCVTLLGSSACGDRVTGGDNASAETGATESGTGEEGEDCGPELAWELTRTNYPGLPFIGSDGQDFIASHPDAVLSFAQGEATWFEDQDLIGEVTGEFVLRSVKDAWVSGSGGSVLHWDGASFSSTLSGLSGERIRVAADGEVYVMGHIGCNQFNCAPRFWQWDGGPWLELDNSDFQRGVDMFALPGGELWVVGADGAFAHRVDGAWELEQFEGGEFDPELITVDGEGRVYALGWAGEWTLLRREEAGVWIVQTLGFDGDEVVRMVPDQEDIILVRDYQPGLELSRWDGLGAPSVIWDSALALPEVSYARNAAGTPEQMLVLANGPAVYGIDPREPAQAPELVMQAPSFRPAPGASAGRDAMFERDGLSLLRWDLDAKTWVEALDLADTNGLDSGSIAELWVEGPEELLFVVRDDEDEQLWRWSGDELGPMALQPQADEFDQLWGTGLDQLWLLGHSEEAGGLWRLEDGAWVEQASPVALGLGLGGNEQELFMAGAKGEVWRHTDEEQWQQLPTLPQNDLHRALIMHVGEELYVFATWIIQGDFDSSQSELYRLEDGNWVVYEGLPAGVESYGDDGGNWAWAVVRTVSPIPELYMREADADPDSPWELVDLGVELDAPTELLVAEDAVILHEDRYTALYSCVVAP